MSSRVLRASDGVTAADARKHLPQRIENAIDRGRSGRGILVVHVAGKHAALGGRVFTVGFNVNGEILIIPRLSHLVVLHEAFDLRFRDGGNLAFVSVEGGETFRGGSFGTNGAKRADQV